MQLWNENNDALKMIQCMSNGSILTEIKKKIYLAHWASCLGILKCEKQNFDIRLNI